MNEEAMRKALKECIKLKGTEILADKSVFKNVIQDMLPGLGLQKERNLLIIAAENFSLGQKLLEAPPHNEAREYVFKRLLQELAEGGLSREAAVAVMQSFTLSLGWEINTAYFNDSIGPEPAAGLQRQPAQPGVSAAAFIADKAGQEAAYRWREDIKEAVIPVGVTAIGDFAFLFCSNLISVVIPDSVTAIGKSAFAGCCSLNGIVIPDSVKTIGMHAFVSCFSLNSITFKGKRYSSRAVFNEAAKACGAARDKIY